MIISFKHKGLKQFYEEGKTGLLRQDQIGRIRRILGLLDTAKEIEGMRVSGLRLHSLTGDLRGFWSVFVSGNWRIIFRFEDGNAYDVELVDYH